MASVSGPAKHRKAASSLSGRPVIPAIPLPHVKRQAAAAANRSANVKNSRPATPIAPENPVAKKSEAKASNTTKQTPAGFTSSAGTKPKASAEQTAHQANEQPVTAQLDSAQDKAKVMAPGTVSPMVSETQPLLEGHVQKASAENDVNVAQPNAVPAQTNGLHTTNSSQTSSETIPHEPNKVDSTSSASSGQPPPSTSNSSTSRQSTAESDASASAVMNGRYRLQQSHLSNNNLHFGALDDSDVSSPGPAAAGGFAPPGFAAHASQSRFNSHAGNGAPRAGPGVHDMMRGSSYDNYGRPMMTFAPIDANHPLSNGLPSTPRSFHGSQSSLQQDDIAAYQQQLPGALPSGLSPDGIPPRPFQNHMPRPMNPPPQMMHHTSPMAMGYNNSQAVGITGFIQQAWLNGQYVDCVLEVRDRRGLADRFLAHHLVLAQSPTLNSLLMEQGLPPFPFSLTPRPPLTLFLNTDNKWFWTESLKLIVHSLYGFPYPNPNPQGPLNDLDASFLIGPPSRGLGVSLSYAAGGHILGISQVLTRGAELATRHLEPRTVDTAMAFALEDYADKGTHEHFKYGDGSKIILHAIVAFVDSNLPPAFHLDVSGTSEGVEYARLPYDLASTPKPHPANVKGNVVGHLSKGSNAQKQLNIQFGDLSVNAQGQEDKSSFTATLSRILLNLPFSSLKLLAEAGPESTAENRLRAVQMAVKEREARRLRALDAVVSGTTPNADAVREMLQSPEPKQNTHWGVLGWREELTRTAEGASLARQWQPLRLNTKPPTPEYP